MLFAAKCLAHATTYFLHADRVGRSHATDAVHRPRRKSPACGPSKVPDDVHAGAEVHVVERSRGLVADRGTDAPLEVEIHDAARAEGAGTRVA